jgi:hypothetical protein
MDGQTDRIKTICLPTNVGGDIINTNDDKFIPLPVIVGSYAPVNLEMSRNLLLKQLVSATPLKLLNRIS